MYALFKIIHTCSFDLKLIDYLSNLHKDGRLVKLKNSDHSKTLQLKHFIFQYCSIYAHKGTIYLIKNTVK